MAHTVFLVEDDQGLREELGTLLTRYGYAWTTTDDYEDVAGQVLASGAHLVTMSAGSCAGAAMCRSSWLPAGPLSWMS